jgi:DNA polymerase-3 subunit epsilon
LTGLTDDILTEFGIHPGAGITKLLKLMEKADYIVAHNGNEFDKPLLEAECERYALKMPVLPWLDTKTDVPYPKRIKTTKLSYLCAEHGFANAGAHRALFDSQAMLRILSKVSFADKHLARDRGYYWNPDAKKWWKSMKASAAQIEKQEAGFEVELQTSK